MRMATTKATATQDSSEKKENLPVLEVPAETLPAPMEPEELIVGAENPVVNYIGDGDYGAFSVSNPRSSVA